MGDRGCNFSQTNSWHEYDYYYSNSDNFSGSNVECDNNQQPGLPLPHYVDPPEGYCQGIDSMGAPTNMSSNTTHLDPFYSASYPGNHTGGSSLQIYQQGLIYAISEQRHLFDSHGSLPEPAMIGGHLPCDHERDQYSLGDPVFPVKCDTQAVPESILNATGHAQQSCVAPLFREDCAFIAASSPRNRLVHSAALSCPVCPVSLGRPQDRKRHILSHLPQWLQCPDPRCPWRGDRWEVLKKHLSGVHPSGSQELDKKKSTIYDPWPLVDGIINGTRSADAAKACAISAVEDRAVELSKLHLWGDSWGRKGRRSDNLDVM